jgi:DNA-binding beta-propeller fold protein YncE
VVTATCLLLAATASGFGFVTSWGGEGTAAGQFKFPSAVAVDTAGNVYVADTENHRIQKFTSQGAHLLSWGSFGTADGQFNRPRGIATDPAGNVYVADTLNNRVQKFDPSGGFLLKWGTFGTGSSNLKFPVGITYGAAQDRMLVADTGNGRLVGYTTAGARDLTLSADALSGPHDVGVGSATYAADPDLNQVRAFNNFSGAHLGSFGGFGSASDQLIAPGGIDVIKLQATLDDIWIADSGNSRLSKWRSAGGGPNEPLLTFGGEGACNGQFRFPHGIATDATGNVYVADTNNHRIQVFSDSGDPNPPCQPVGTVPPATTQPATTQPTGQRAAALEKCKRKKSKKARKRCKKKAKKLPV